MDELDKILAEIDKKRKEVAAQNPPNETQELMTEGVIMGLDIAGLIVQAVKDERSG